MGVSGPLQVITDPVKKKRKRFNKNKKNAWRTKIDMSDIDAAFEEKRREERFGGPIAEQSTENLFTIDIGEGSSPLTVDEVGTPIENLRISDGLKPHSKKGRRIARATLTCHKLLKGLPGVKAISRKKPVQPQHFSREVQLIRRVADDSGHNALHDAIKLEKKIHQSNDDQKNYRIKRNKSRFLRQSYNKDLWDRGVYDASPVEINVKGEVSQSYLAPNIEFLANSMKRRGPNRKNRPPTTTIPAVPIPKPGTSYNPKFEDHQALLLEAMEEHVNILEEKKKKDDYVKKVLPWARIQGGPARLGKEENLEELSQGVEILNVHQPQDLEKSEDDEEQEVVPPPKVHEKKLPQERRKMAKRKFLERRLLVAKDKLRRENDVYRVKSINKELIQVDKIKVAMRAKRMKRLEEALGKPKKLSKRRVRPMHVIVPLENDLRGTLLEVKSVGNLLEEKFKLLHHRNLLETRGNKKPTKAKRKTYFKGRGPSLSDSAKRISMGTV